MQVLKFGGSSVASAAAIGRVVEIVSKAIEHDRTIVVCSAIGGCTDTLIEIGRRAASGDESFQTLLDQLKERHHTIISELLPGVFQEKVTETVDDLFSKLGDTVRGIFLLREISRTSLDAVQSYGELFLTKIVTAKFSSLGISCKWLDAREIVKTCSGQVNQEKTFANVREAVDIHTSLFVVPGFIGSDEQGRVSTLGRGGSDYTASLLAVGIKARLVEIWTDVPGIMTADPKVVPTARTIRNISYTAAQELSHFGAKVIYPPTIQPVVEEGIPIYVKNTFDPEDPGTLVEKYPPQNREDVTGISNSVNIALISLEGSGMVGIPGFSSRLFDALSREGINIILITQASSVHTMCIAISAKDAQRAKEAADNCFAYEISLGRLRP
ncbi:MAG: aspartate kinase, partial [Bacteroidales bacterium]|nr:aspartate kinase [Bacteroidales bacterium]